MKIQTFIAVILIALSAPALSEEKRELILELLELTQAQNNHELLINSYIRKFSSNPIMATEKFEQKIRAAASWDVIVEPTIRIYQETYTAEELKSMNDFFSTPIGQSLISKTPEVNERISTVLVNNMQPVLKHFKSKNEVNEKRAVAILNTIQEARKGSRTEKPGFLTVTEAQLRAAADSGSFAIESEGIIYTFDDSAYNIDTSQVTDMSYLFRYAQKTGFNEDIGYWDVSNVTNMEGVFFGAIAFNQNISEWDVSKVTNMKGMFFKALAFNQDISQWDVSKVTNMNWLFGWCESFNQPLEQWDVSEVTNMNGMFLGATLFNQSLNSWNVSNVTDMTDMFKWASSFNKPLDKWNVSKITNMDSMFESAESFNQDLSRWDTSRVSDEPVLFIRKDYPTEKLPGW